MSLAASVILWIFGDGVLWILSSTILLSIAAFNIIRWRMVNMINKVPGLPSLPIIGNTIEVNVDHDEIFARVAATRYLWGRTSGICKAWLGIRPYIFISKASAVEVILSSSKHIEKSRDYSYLHPWLGQGLLTSSGAKWQFRRKILTPSFHFRILDDFLGVFTEHARMLTMILSREIDKGPFNLFPYITRCTLDIICETAMGRQIHAQTNENSEYAEAVYRIGSIIQTRQAKIWLQPEWLFKFSPLYKQHQECLEYLHGFSNRVIKEKRAELKKVKEGRLNYNSSNDEETNYGVKKRLAFLDLLLKTAEEEKVPLSDEDIREEVDTFMFEGHDTTSAALCWLLFLLGSNPKIQEKVFNEQQSIFGDSGRNPTTQDLTKMKYLECCIKEALRLYPSVPMFARLLTSDVKIDKFLIPAGTTAMIVAYQLHRDPEVFPQPERFIPERFLDRDSTRNPFGYVPFSAGPRNCIGQKFALMEEKVIVSWILRKFKITSDDKREDLVLLAELILRPKNGIRISIEPRR
ncbi:cytochrome P450 4c3-like isoform X2 [Rhodnius prolixus]|uniref:cytochrome P450 4c3-like isoform X2 n=1 Tax=Rhodnius prolixus TaxID=13249 RepID=UPI003D187E82